MSALRPKDVADRWQCSERHVYSQINLGRLRAFRIGPKMIRIPPEALAEYENEFPEGCGEKDATSSITALPPKNSVLANPAKNEKRSPDKIYFIICEQYVKIGTTSNLEARLLDMRTGNPFKMELAASIAGGHRTERELHARYKEFRYQGEWFHLRGELASYVADLRKIYARQIAKEKAAQKRREAKLDAGLFKYLPMPGYRKR
jgi:hypothetical protein